MTLKLQGVNFGSAFWSAGADGFIDGNEYWHHRLLKQLGVDFEKEECTLITKTATIEARLDPENKKGNLAMKKGGIIPREFFPKCILPNFRPGNILLSIKMFREGFALNAVGLSGPGFEALLKTGQWQKKTRPFIISFMPVASTPEGRLLEVSTFAQLLMAELPNFKAKIAVELNLFCPNVKKVKFDLVGETKPFLKVLSPLGIPIIVKLSVMAPIEAALEISQDPNCGAIDISNTVHWDDLEEVGIDRKKLFGTDVSPLAEYGGGGLSGAPLFPLVIDYICKLRNAGCTKPIIAGGGILKASDVHYLCWTRPGMDSISGISIGTATMLRPRNVHGIIKMANDLFTRTGITSSPWKFK